MILRHKIIKRIDTHQLFNEKTSQVNKKTIFAKIFKMKILILNGPNLNLLGKREPEIYGHVPFNTYFEQLKLQFPKHQLVYYQSNHEGCLIDKLQEADGDYDAVVMNPGAYAHTSIALADCIRAIDIPVIEVHISDISKREPYRRHSFTAEACIKCISGLGMEGYAKAIEAFM